MSNLVPRSQYTRWPSVTTRVFATVVQHQPIYIGGITAGGEVIDFVRVRYGVGAGAARTWTLQKVPNGTAYSGSATLVSSANTSVNAQSPADQTQDFSINRTGTVNVLAEKDVLVLRLSGAVGTLADVIVEIGTHPRAN